jgi:hypothetical protein
MRREIIIVWVLSKNKIWGKVNLKINLSVKQMRILNKKINLLLFKTMEEQTIFNNNTIAILSLLMFRIARVVFLQGTPIVLI